MMTTQASVDRSVTVNDMIARHPATIAVFNRFGIDACCGGAATIEEASARDGADLTALLDALQRAADGAADGATDER